MGLGMHDSLRELAKRLGARIVSYTSWDSEYDGGRYFEVKFFLPRRGS